MQKYKQYFDRMLKDHQDLFDAFKPIHDQYVLEPDKFQSAFNRIGKEIVEIIEEYENRLCSRSERGQYGKFSHKLAEAFRREVRKVYPKIDDVGIEVSYTKSDLDYTLDGLTKTSLIT